MSNPLSFWNGQPLTGPVYPQMGDASQPNAMPPQPAPSTAVGRQWTTHGMMQHYPYGGAGAAPPRMPMPTMVNFGNVNAPLACPIPNNFFGQGPYEPCIENGEAFCAYNGMDMSMGGGAGGGGSMGGQSGAKGDFW